MAHAAIHLDLRAPWRKTGPPHRSEGKHPIARSLVRCSVPHSFPYSVLSIAIPRRRRRSRASGVILTWGPSRTLAVSRGSRSTWRSDKSPRSITSVWPERSRTSAARGAEAARTAPSRPPRTRPLPALLEPAPPALLPAPAVFPAPPALPALAALPSRRNTSLPCSTAARAPRSSAMASTRFANAARSVSFAMRTRSSRTPAPSRASSSASTSRMSSAIAGSAAITLTRLPRPVRTGPIPPLPAHRGCRLRSRPDRHGRWRRSSGSRSA